MTVDLDIIISAKVKRNLHTVELFQPIAVEYGLNREIDVDSFIL